jgi:nucleotide-binding universal stress UspA family protein
MQEIHRILVPVDFSEHSQRALDEAVGLAKKFGAEIHLLHCYQLYPVGAVPPYDVVMPEDLERTIREGARKLLAEWGRKAADRGVSVTEHLAVGPPSSSIAELAERLGVDLIVIGTRGLTGLKHVLLGSVAERTIRIAPCPVLSVKHPEVDR